MKNTISQPKSHFLLAKCVLASLAFHSAILYVWIHHPISLNSCKSLFLSSAQDKKTVPSEGDFHLDKTLEEFFENLFLANTEAPLQSDPTSLPETKTPLLHGTKLEKTSDPIAISSYNPYVLTNSLEESLSPLPPSFMQEEQPLSPLLGFHFIPSVPPISSEHTKAISHELSAFDCTYTPLLPDTITLQEKSHPQLECFSKDPNDYLVSSPHPILEKPLPHTFSSDLVTAKETTAPPLSLSSPTALERSFPENLLAQASLSEVDDYLATGTLYGMQWNNTFTLTPSFFADDDGYVFSLTLASNEIKQAEPVKQNFYFLVDVSSSLENHKIAVFKRSVIKALSALKSGDQFNIFLLDKKITQLSPDNLPFSFQNLRKAEAFLERKNERAVFASFDLFQGLDKTLDLITCNNDEMHTAILLTNGKFSTKPAQTQKDLSRFLNKNKGKLTVFSAAVGKNNDLVHLDMLSSLSGGKLLYSDTNASLPRKLGLFIKTLGSPLAKDIQLSIRTNDPKAEITLLPKASRSAHLYNNEPFVIMGKTNRLCDLLINLEGKNEEGWVLLTKEVEFSSAEESSLQEKKEWALRQASLLYEKFLQDPKNSYLLEAKEILKISHGRTLGE